MSIDARTFLDSIAGFTDGSDSNSAPSSADLPAKIGVVDASYTGGATALVRFDGELTTGGRGYVAVSPVRAGDRVVLMPVGRSYVIVGAVNSYSGSLPYLGTIDSTWTNGKPNVTLADGAVVSAFLPANDADVQPGGTVILNRLPGGVWYIVAAVNTGPAFPRWLDISLGTGWTWASKPFTAGSQANGTIADALYHKPQVTKTTGNYVELAGTITQGATATILIGTLPVGFRPLVDQYFVIPYVSGSLASIGVNVKTDGTINAQALIATGAIFSLDGIGFTVDSGLTWTTLASIGYLNSWADVGGSSPVGALTVDANYRVFARGRLKRTAGTVVANNMTNAISAAFRADSTTGTSAMIFLALDPGVLLRRYDLQLATGALTDQNGAANATSLDISTQWLSTNYPGSWTSPTIVVGGDYNNGYPVRAYTKTPDGMVQLRGVLSSTTGGKQVANLPIGYRPVGVRRFPIVQQNIMGSFLVMPDGSIYFESGTGWLELNRIRFVAEQ